MLLWRVVLPALLVVSARLKLQLGKKGVICVLLVSIKMDLASRTAPFVLLVTTPHQKGLCRVHLVQLAHTKSLSDRVRSVRLVGIPPVLIRSIATRVWQVHMRHLKVVSPVLLVVSGRLRMQLDKMSVICALKVNPKTKQGNQTVYIACLGLSLTLLGR